MDPARFAAPLALALLAAGSASAQWQQRDVLDPRSGDTVNAPGGRNERGFQLDLLRADSGEVFAFFRLPPGDRDFLDAAKPPILALDGGPQQSVLLIEAGLTWAAFPVWNGQGSGTTGLLRDLMQAAALEVTYFLHGGGYKSTRFALDGAAPLLAAAFAIPERLSADEIADARELETALEQEGARCLELKGKKRQRCLDVARACLAKVTSATELHECIAASSSGS
jgi:hypothetical protein